MIKRREEEKKREMKDEVIHPIYLKSIVTNTRANTETHLTSNIQSVNYRPSLFSLLSLFSLSLSLLSFQSPLSLLSPISLFSLSSLSSISSLSSSSSYRFLGQ